MFKVLLADDESIENEALKVVIQNNIKEALVVGMAQKGEDVILMDSKFSPDLIFIGVTMPGMSGLDAAAAIKKKNPHRKIIMISANEKFEWVQRALRLRVEDYLLKPLSPDGIVEILKHYIEQNKRSVMKKQEQFILECFLNNDYEKMKEVLKMLTDSFQFIPFSDALSTAKNLLNGIWELKKEFGSRQEDMEQGEGEFELFSPKTIEEVKNDLLSEVENLLRTMSYHCKTSPHTDSLKFALNYIEKNFRNNIMLQDVADELNFSNAYLSKRFKKDLGTNFNKYLTQRRIDEAKNLLTHSRASINDIAFDIGYNEPNYFCKVFKKSEGVTPSEYREKNKLNFDL